MLAEKVDIKKDFQMVMSLFIVRQSNEWKNSYYSGCHVRFRWLLRGRRSDTVSWDQSLTELSPFARKRT